MRPAGLISLVNHSQMPRPPFAHNVIRSIQYLHHHLSSAQLSNKAPNLEAKMEKGISNNQKGSGGSPLTIPHVFKEKQPLEGNCLLSVPLTHRAPHILTAFREGRPLRGCFRWWLVVRRENTDSLRPGWYSRYLWVLQQWNLQSGKARHCSLTSSQGGYC